jgi:hypothetical protein
VELRIDGARHAWLNPQAASADLPRVSPTFHSPGCAKATRAASCDCSCHGTRHGLASGVFFEAVEGQLDIRLDYLPGADREVFVKTAGEWLALSLTSGESAGAILDKITDKATKALNSSKTPHALGAEHCLCTILTILYECRDQLVKAAEAGATELANVVAREFSQRLGSGNTTDAFENAFTDALTKGLASKLADVILKHIGLPTREQLVVLIVVFCPKLNEHDAATTIVTDNAVQDLVKTAAASAIQNQSASATAASQQTTPSP